ncbi:MAG: hypothetical protein MZU97_18525 [Bacillus subtilis]|nr:hypothetical protein [Bacillus subtilis]
MNFCSDSASRLEGSFNKERKEIVGYYEELIQDAIDSGKTKRLSSTNWVRSRKSRGP